MATNIGHLFYKQYFSGLKLNRNTGKPVLKDPVNQKLFDLELTDYSNLIETPYKKPPVSLTTIYPGLLIGSGYNHEVGGKEIEDELKLGFFFDHTTGLPVIPGSSVKGLLRSAFKKAGGDYVKELLAELKITFGDDQDILSLEKTIFENSEAVSVYKRDIFFDAYPISSGNENSTFHTNDYITSHENPLKNPKPVQFLKILPNVQFQFNFKLTDSGGLSAENKLKLFEQILLDLGIGAKTNVGYGQFKQRGENPHNDKENTDKPDYAEIARKIKEKEAAKTETEKRVVTGANLKCKVVEITKKEVFFMFDWDDKLKFKKKKTRFNVELKVDDVVEIKIVDDFYIRGTVLFSNDITIIKEG